MNKGKKPMIFITSVICALLFIGLAIPMVQKKIEPNYTYGVRIDEALSSKEAWYEINYYGGWAMIVSSIIMLVANIILYITGKRLSDMAYTGIFVAILLVCVLTSSYITSVYASQITQ